MCCMDLMIVCVLIELIIPLDYYIMTSVDTYVTKECHIIP